MKQIFDDTDTRNLKWYTFPPRELPEDFLEMDIAGLELSNRSVQALREKEIHIVRDVLDYSMKRLSDIPGVEYANARKISDKIELVFRRYRNDYDCSRVPYEVVHRILVKNYSPLRAFRMHYRISLDHIALQTKISRELLEKYDAGDKYLKNAAIAAAMGLSDRAWQLDDREFRQRWNMAHIPAAINEVYANGIPVEEAAEKHMIDKELLVDFKLWLSCHWGLELSELSGKQLASRLDNLDIPNLAKRILKEAGIHNLAGIVIRAPSQLLCNPSFGNKSFYKIRDAIEALVRK